MEGAAAYPHPCPVTSTLVRYGAAALVIVFYVDAFMLGGEWSSWVLFGALLIPAVAGIIVTTRQLPRAARPRLIDVALALTATLVVAAVVRDFGLPPVLAASLVGVVAALASVANDRLGSVAVPWYCGCFAGMTSELVLADWLSVTIAGLGAGLLVSLLRTTWDGVGGKLGLLAFSGVFLTSFVSRELGTIGPGAPVFDFDVADRVALVAVPPLAATITWALWRRGSSPVLASAAPTAAFALLLLLLDDNTPLGDVMPFTYPSLCIAWFGGSFIGMTAPDRVGHRLWPLLVAASLFGVLQIAFKPTIAGFGGDFGATASVAVVAVIGLVAVVRHVEGLRRTAGP